MNASSTLWGFYFCVQFPMGKVKTRVLLQLTMELNKYQFPMGKVKAKETLTLNELKGINSLWER